MAAAEVTALTLLLVYRGKAEKAVRESMSGVFEMYGGDDPAVAFSLDRAQQKVRLTCIFFSSVKFTYTKEFHLG